MSRRVRSSESDSFGALPARFERVSLEKKGALVVAPRKRAGTRAGALALDFIPLESPCTHNELPRAVVASGNPIIPYESANIQPVASRRVVVHFRLCVDEISRRIVARNRESVSREMPQRILLSRGEVKSVNDANRREGKEKKKRPSGVKERIKILYTFFRDAAK